MIASKISARAATRSLRAPIRHNARQIRFASTGEEASKKGFSAGLVGGLTGGALVFIAGYGYYHMSGAKSIVNAASFTKKQFSKVTSELQQKTPEPNEALKWLRSTATSYAAFIPGGKSYVDTAFNDLETVQQNHGDEVNKIVLDCYAELKDATKKGMSIETATKSWEALENAMKALGDLAVDSATELLDSHPQLKKQIGGNLDQLKNLADSNGGQEAKKELDQTYQQIKDVIKGGVSIESIEKIKKLVQEKTEKVKQLGDEAWKKGLEQTKPYLDKNPQIKEIVESNADALKQGNIGELFQKVKDAVSSGNTEELQDYAKKAGEKVKNSGAGQGFEQYVNMIPGASEAMPKFQKLQELAKTRGDEAEKILKGAYKDIEEVLKKRTEEAEKLAEKAGDEAKK